VEVIQLCFSTPFRSRACCVLASMQAKLAGRLPTEHASGGCWLYVISHYVAWSRVHTLDGLDHISECTFTSQARWSGMQWPNFVSKPDQCVLWNAHFRHWLFRYIQHWRFSFCHVSQHVTNQQQTSLWYGILFQTSDTAVLLTSVIFRIIWHSRMCTVTSCSLTVCHSVCRMSI